MSASDSLIEYGPNVTNEVTEGGSVLGIDAAEPSVLAGVRQEASASLPAPSVTSRPPGVERPGAQAGTASQVPDGSARRVLPASEVGRGRGAKPASIGGPSTVTSRTDHRTGTELPVRP
jgi:hypothetical protein